MSTATRRATRVPDAKRRFPKVALPPHMRNNPVDENMYTLPWTTIAEPLEKIKERGGVSTISAVNSTEPSLTARAVENKLCQGCGKPCGKDLWLMYFGDESELTRPLDEPPVHYECAQYALQTCPHLRGKADSLCAEVKLVNVSGYEVTLDEEATYQHNGWAYQTPLIIIKLSQILDIEVWRNGKRLEKEALCPVSKSGQELEL